MKKLNRFKTVGHSDHWITTGWHYMRSVLQRLIWICAIYSKFAFPCLVQNITTDIRSIHVVCRSACRSDARALNTCMDKTPASTVRNSRGLNLEDAKFANRGSRDSLSTGYSRDAVHRYPAQGAQSHYGRKLKLNKLCLHQTALLRLSFPPRGPENLKIQNN
jgi:hypothetical protein